MALDTERGYLFEHNEGLSGSAREPIIFDTWASLSFKRQLGSRSVVGAGAGFKPPEWVGADHLRRIQAYAILRAYMDNIAREFMHSTSRADIDDRREYGDPALLVNTVLAALLGEDQQILTEGAEEANPDDTDVHDRPEDRQRQAEAQASAALQDWLRDWATDERLGLKMIEIERRAVGLGDGVATLGWSSDKQRPRLRVWDPTFYFPVLSDGNEDDFPEKIHIAWEIPDKTLDGSAKIKLRRLTWELADIRPAQVVSVGARMIGRDDTLHPGDRINADGKIERDYEWNDRPSTKTCYYTEATWTLDTVQKDVMDLTANSAEYELDEDGNEVKEQDLFIDFMPVVHVPNTVAIIDHFGRSVISTVLQILDDISNADSDLSAASATTGHPVLALSGAHLEKDGQGRSRMSYRPGEVLETGEGKMDVLDTSNSLQALIGYIEFLLKRLSVNSRVAEALMGRVKPSEVPSGIALALGFGPTDNLVKEMRLVRSEKYPLLLKFAHRMALAGGADVPKEWVHSEIKMGSFLPQDRSSAVDEVTKLYATAKAISLETAIVILVEAGFPIRDAIEEVHRIQERDFEGAAALLDITGDQALTHAYLGLPEPVEPDPAQVDVPVNIDPATGQPIPPQPVVTGTPVDPATFDASVQPA